MCKRTSPSSEINYYFYKFRFNGIKNKHNCNNLSDIKLNETNKSVVLIRSIRVIKTKKNEEMAFIAMFDDSSELDGVMFPLTFNKFKNIIEINKPYLLSYKVENRNEKLQAVIETIYNLS